MTIIEVILPDGSIRAHLTAAREAAMIAQEVRRTYPEASHWRIGRGWQGAGESPRPYMYENGSWVRIAAIASVLAVVLALLPIVCKTGLVVTLFGSLLRSEAGNETPARHETPVGATAPAQQAAPAGDMGGVGSVHVLAPQDIVIASIAEQASDTSRTLLVHLTNTGSQTRANIKLQVTFYDRDDQAIPGEQMGDNLTLGPGQTGSIKVWARSKTGIERYDLAILD